MTVTYFTAPKLILSTLAFACLFINAGCSTLNAPKKIQAKVIETHRSNITTSPQISSVANSILLSSGLTQEECMTAFDECLTQLQSVLALSHSQSIPADQSSSYPAKPILAFLAELYYAQALYLDTKSSCQSPRPPINPDYANAPLSAEEQADKQNQYHACLLAKREAIKASINHSYGYLFYDALTGQETSSPLISESDIKAQDLYHVASNTLINEMYQQEQGVFANAQRQGVSRNTEGEYGHLLAGRYHTDDTQVNLYLANDPYYLANLDTDAEHLLADLVSAYDARLTHLSTISSRTGLGVPYVGVLSNRQLITIKELVSQQSAEDVNLTSEALPIATEHAKYLHPTDDDLRSRIHPTGHISLTGIVKPQGTTLQAVLSADVLNVHFFNPYDNQEINILGKNYPLSANYSAGYALWLAENQLQGVGILNMLNKNTASLPQLFMLKPYNPKQKVIIMIHGLASSPATWVNLTNNLFNDPVLRDNYQVWQVFYATNLPILENRYQIHELINAAYALTDPTGNNPASQHSIIIGHSMGGIMARMLVSDDDLIPRLKTLNEPSVNLEEQSPDIIVNEAALDERLIRQLLSNVRDGDFKNRFDLQSLPQVDTAVFISAPFAGTDYAERWFTRFARRVVRLPLDLTKGVTTFIADTITLDDNHDVQGSIIGSLYLQNGPSQLSDRSAFMKLTKELTINDGVTYHTIMGDYNGSAESLQGNLAGQNLSDGIVPYDSSHLDGAMSETIITGGHNIHENPKTILQLRKILHEHLRQHDAKESVHNNINSTSDGVSVDEVFEVTTSPN